MRANRRINNRTTTNLRGAISLNSRRFEDFQPSSGTSFPPADQDLFRGSGAIGVDYRPWTKFSTGLEGRLETNQTVNLPATASINNADQTTYNIIWSWTANPLNFWTLTQNNTAGAVQITYPFA